MTGGPHRVVDMNKTEARRELQRRLVILKETLRNEIENFAIEHQLEFEFMGMKYFLKDPYGSDRWAKRGIFISAGEWQSSSWGCSDNDSYEAYARWEEENFPPLAQRARERSGSVDECAEED